MEKYNRWWNILAQVRKLAEIKGSERLDGAAILHVVNKGKIQVFVDQTYVFFWKIDEIKEVW